MSKEPILQILCQYMLSPPCPTVPFTLKGFIFKNDKQLWVLNQRQTKDGQKSFSSAKSLSQQLPLYPAIKALNLSNILSSALNQCKTPLQNCTQGADHANPMSMSSFTHKHNPLTRDFSEQSTRMCYGLRRIHRNKRVALQLCLQSSSMFSET